MNKKQIIGDGILSDADGLRTTGDAALKALAGEQEPWPPTLYAIPDDWGDYGIMMTDEEVDDFLEEMIEDANGSGNWEDASIDDCGKFWDEGETADGDRVYRRDIWQGGDSFTVTRHDASGAGEPVIFCYALGNQIEPTPEMEPEPGPEGLG